MTEIRVLLVAQSPVLCYGFRTVLETAFSIDGVTEATGALEAAGYAREGCFDLVVVHDALPGVTGDIATAMLRQLQPGATIVVMSDDDSEAHRERITGIGGNALYSMAMEPESFSLSICGLPRLEPADRLQTDATINLPLHQIAVLDGIARQIEPWMIAERLRVDLDAVARATDALLIGLDAVDRASAISAAIRLGLVDLQDQLPVLRYHHDFGIESAA